MDRWLIILRHAKSAWPDVADHDRPLAPRGLRDAPNAGRWLHDAGYVPDRVICSTARRARETYHLAQAHFGAEPPVDYEDGLYGADVDEVLEFVHATPDTTSRLMLVGHEPWVSDITLHLARSGEAIERVRVKYPTAGIAVLSVGGSWAELGEGTAVLKDFHTPR
jgi:phosphohistidine phosphatase